MGPIDVYKYKKNIQDHLIALMRRGREPVVPFIPLASAYRFHGRLRSRPFRTIFFFSELSSKVDTLGRQAQADGTAIGFPGSGGRNFEPANAIK